MLVKKTGYPVNEEVVLCTVTKVQNHGVFARLDEYERTSGLIHISEIAPGRIRNIREYVIEGKVVVCKVLRTDKERGHIDLSLRRVNESLRRRKLDEIKQLAKAEKIIIHVAKDHGLKPDDLFLKVQAVLSEYDSLYDAFLDIVEGGLDLTKTDLDEKIAMQLQEVIIERIKPPSVSIRGKVQVTSFASDGVEKVRAALVALEKFSTIMYAGGGRYSFEIIDADYKAVEKAFTQFADVAQSFQSKECVIAVSREKR